MSAETFSYKGISAGKYIEGEIEAINQEEASFKLKEQKIIITNLTKLKKKKAEKEKGKKSGFSFGKKKVTPADVMLFSKQFATMVKAGLPILNVLTMLRDQIEHPTMKEIIEDVRKSLEGGITLSKCFEKIITSAGVTFFLPKEKPLFLPFSFSAFFFLTLIKFVMIIFCSLSLKEASS